MAVIPLRSSRRRLSMRYYLCTTSGPVRVPLRLFQKLVAGEVALPEFAGTVQHFAEVLVTRGSAGRQVKIRATTSKFDDAGHIDLSHAVEAVDVAVMGPSPRKIGNKVIDIGPTIRSNRLKEENSWRLSPDVRRKIRADLSGDIKLATLRAGTR